ncbi:transketolase family protein [Candidatus Woesearchaeota archaeon]|nr:transketolase family protein [Candidatus Woesearchaeota archaeon]
MTKPVLAKGLRREVAAWWHGDVTLERAATREGFGQGLLAAAKKNDRVIALTANLGGSTCLDGFRKQYPQRFIDVGVAEQSLVGVAVGLASEGFLPVATSFAVFSPGRNWDFIRVQVAMSKQPVIVVGSHAGLATGPDGATHQALEDVSLMRGLPGMTVLSPLDAAEAAKAIAKSVAVKEPTYLRLVRAKTPLLTKKSTPYVIGRALPLLKGTDVAILTTGTMAFTALEAAKLLWQKKWSASVTHFGTIKPLDERAVLAAAKNSKVVVTLEDHNIIGGFGSAVAEALAKKPAAPLLRMGVRDLFGESGTPGQLYKKHGLDAATIARRITKQLS